MHNPIYGSLCGCSQLSAMTVLVALSRQLFKTNLAASLRSTWQGRSGDGQWLTLSGNMSNPGMGESTIYAYPILRHVYYKLNSIHCSIPFHYYIAIAPLRISQRQAALLLADGDD